jgi:hypothetical protein
MNKKIQTLLLSITLVPFHVLSSQPDFNQIEITLGQSKMQHENHDTYSLSGNLSLTDKYYLSAEFERFEHEEYQGADFYFLGAGYVYSLNATSNLYSQLDYTHREMVSEYDASLSGYRLTLGYRNQINVKLEGYVKAAYLSLESNENEYESSNNDSLIAIGLKYKITNVFGGIAELNDSGFKLGLRFEF